MKKLFLTLFLFVSLIEAKSQTVISSCTAPDSIKELYKQDAAIMALRRIYEIKSTDTSLITISQIEQDSIMEALMAVYNATSLPARDTVIEMFNIHTWPSPSKSIYVDVMDTSTSIDNFMYNIFPTGDPILDSLISRYNISVTVIAIGFLPYTFMVELNYLYILNPDPLIDSLDLVQGLSYASVNYPVGGGDDIQYSFYPGGTSVPSKALIFHHGWGDCLSGCINNRYWSFKVWPDCSVEYVGSYGDKLDTTSTNIANANQNDANMQIFPNPFNDNVSINLNGIENESLEIRLFDAIGNAVLSDHINNLNGKTVNYNLTSLKSGIYIIEIIGDKNIYKKVVIKE